MRSTSQSRKKIAQPAADPQSHHGHHVHEHINKHASPPAVRADYALRIRKSQSEIETMFLSKGTLISSEELSARDTLASVRSEHTLIKFMEQYEKVSEEDRRDHGFPRNLRGEVWTVVHRKTLVKCVLRIASKDRVRTSAFGEFERALSIQRRISHKHVLPIADYFEDSDSLYAVTEFAAKGNLYTVISSKGKLTEAETFRYFWQLCDALHFLQERRIVHRNLRPENMLIGSSDELRLTNFSCCAELPDGKDDLYFRYQAKHVDGLSAALWSTWRPRWSSTILTASVPTSGASVLFFTKCSTASRPSRSPT